MVIICLDDSESLLPHGIILGPQGLKQSHRIALKPIRQSESGRNKYVCSRQEKPSCPEIRTILLLKKIWEG